MASISFLAALFLSIALFLTLEVNIASATKTNERVTQLHFYVQERIKSPNATTIKVVSSPTSKYNQPYNFGDIFVFDDFITVGRDPTSRLLGRAHGTTTITSLDGFDGLNTVSLDFTDLYPWTGSSLTTVGGFSFRKDTFELQVVGGTGRFRLARGYAVAKTLSSYDPNIITFEIKVVLLSN